MASWVNANKKNMHVTSCLEVCLSLSVSSLQSTAHKGGLDFQFQKEGHRLSAKILHSIIWPAETAKNGCSKTENDWLPIRSVAQNIYRYRLVYKILLFLTTTRKKRKSVPDVYFALHSNKWP